MPEHNQKKTISIVIPLKNEAESIGELYKRLCDVIGSLNHTFEIVFIDDGSTDSTLQTIKEMHQHDPRVKAISFSRNFGHQAALSAGIDYARGDAVIMMDGDLQHPPELLPTLIQYWLDGNDIVYTVREDTVGVSKFKLRTARWFYSLINKIGNVNIPPNTADFRLLSRPVLNELKRLDERALFLRGLVQWVGFTHHAVPYTADKRFAGTTKYHIRNMLKLAMDGITSFSNAPLHLSLYLGFTISMFSFLYGLFAIYMKLFTDSVLPGWTSILVAVLFLGGVQLITIGIIGLYVGKLYTEVKNRPRYIVRDVLGGLQPDQPDNG